MLKTLLLTLIIVAVCTILLCIKVIIKKNGRFPNTHIEGNTALRKKKIYCAKTEERVLATHKNLYDRLKEE